MIGVIIFWYIYEYIRYRILKEIYKNRKKLKLYKT